MTSAYYIKIITLTPIIGMGLKKKKKIAVYA